MRPKRRMPGDEDFQRPPIRLPASRGSSSRRAADSRKHLGDDRAPRIRAHQPQPEVPVLAAVAHGLVEAADRLEGLAAHQRGAVHGVARQQRPGGRSAPASTSSARRRTFAANGRRTPPPGCPSSTPTAFSNHAAPACRRRRARRRARRSRDARRDCAPPADPDCRSSAPSSAALLRPASVSTRRRVGRSVVDHDDLEVLEASARERSSTASAMNAPWLKHGMRTEIRGGIMRHRDAPTSSGSSVSSARYRSATASAGPAMHDAAAFEQQRAIAERRDRAGIMAHEQHRVAGACSSR